MFNFFGLIGPKHWIISFPYRHHIARRGVSTNKSIDSTLDKQTKNNIKI